VFVKLVARWVGQRDGVRTFVEIRRSTVPTHIDPTVEGEGFEARSKKFQEVADWLHVFVSHVDEINAEGVQVRVGLQT
jgi:hypothetical protein